MSVPKYPPPPVTCARTSATGTGPPLWTDISRGGPILKSKNGKTGQKNPDYIANFVKNR